MKRYFLAVLAVSLLAWPAFADGPETGVISGKVSDASGSPLPGVMVTIVGERGEKSVQTDADGNYRFALLVPGNYSVQAELEGFQGGSQAAAVTAGGKVDVDFRLTMGTEETITVTSEAPMVDKFNVSAGATVSSEVGQEVSGSTRTYYGVINTLPGVTSDAQNEDIQQTRPSVNGAHWSDNNVFIDGVDTSFARFGGSRVFLPTTAVTEVTMEAGGSSAEYGRSAGSTTNVIVKSGTNRFHGDVLAQRQEVDWASDYDSHVELTQRQNFPKPANFFKRSPLEEEGTSTGFETSLGGPLKKDEAWFFLGWSDFDTNDLDKALNGDPVDVSLNTEARIAKFNLQPGANHQLSFSWIDTPASRNYFNPESNDYWTPTPHVVDGELATLNWNWSASQSVFVETKIATQTSDENKFLACGGTDLDECIRQKQADRGPSGEGPLRFPANPAAGEHWPGNNYRVYIDTDNDSAWNNGWILDNGFGLNEFPRDQANVSLTQFIGANHELKYGVDWQEVEWRSDVSRPGLYSGPQFDALNPFGFSRATGGLGIGECGIARLNQSDVDAINASLFGGLPVAGIGSVCLFRDYNADALVADRGTGDSLNEDVGLYLRDRFTVGDHWTFNLGLRYEDASGKNDIGRTVFDSQHIAPRVAITYDLEGDGRQLVSLNVGRYYAQLNQQWTNEHLQDQWGGYAEYDDYLFCDAVDVGLGLCNAVGYNLLLRGIRPGRMWELVDQGIWDSDITPYYKDEIILGWEWQFSQNWALDVKGIYWELGNMVGATTQAGPLGEQFKFVANYDDYAAILRAIDAERVRLGSDPLLNSETLANFEEGRKEYEAVQIQLNRRFSTGWAWYNNITLSELETSGAGAWWNNTNSDYGTDLHVVLTQQMIDQCNSTQTIPSPRTGLTRRFPVDCNVLSPFLGQPVSTINRFGNEGTIDRPVILNSFGFKTFTFGRQNLTLGGHLTFQSGTAWARSEGVSIFAVTGTNARNDSTTLQVERPGSRRLDDIYSLNLSGAWGFPLGFGDLNGQLRLEVLNVTDQQEQVFVTSQGEVRPVRRDFQRPRQARVSLSLRF